MIMITSETLFTFELNKAIKEKFGALDEKHADYLNRELKLINNVPDKWVKTMLNVSGMVRYMKKHYPDSISSGYGAITGSFVAYLLDITGIDPVVYNLMPERFYITSATMPSIDIGIAPDYKTIAIQYLLTQYGEKCVFGCLNSDSTQNASAVFVSELPYEGMLDLKTGFFCNETGEALIRKGYIRINLIPLRLPQYIMNQCSGMKKLEQFNPVMFNGLYDSLFSNNRSIYAAILSQYANKIKTFDDFIMAVSEYYDKSRMELFENCDLYNIQKIDSILSDTRGHIVYQEQILSLLQDIMHIDFLTANEIRKSIAKKDAAVINTIFADIVTELIKRNMNFDEVIRFWNNFLAAVPIAPTKAHSVAVAFDTMKSLLLAKQEEAFCGVAKNVPKNNFTFRMQGTIRFNKPIVPKQMDISVGGYEMVMNGKTIQFDFEQFIAEIDTDDKTLLHFSCKNPDEDTFHDIKSVTKGMLTKIESITEFYVESVEYDSNGNELPENTFVPVALEELTFVLPYENWEGISVPKNVLKDVFIVH